MTSLLKPICLAGIIIVISTIKLYASDQISIANFSASKDTVSKEETVTISWMVTGATKVYIHGIGDVDSIGTKSIKFKESMDLDLFAENATQLAHRKLTIKVFGIKNVRAFPEMNAYETSLSRVVSLDNPQLTEVIKKVMQHLESDDYFVNSYFNPLDQTTVIQTSFRTNPGLVTESYIGARRVSFLIKIDCNPNAKLSNITIFGCIEYRRKTEKPYKKETDSEIYNAALTSLQNTLLNQFGG